MIKCEIVCDNYEAAPKSIETQTIQVHRSVFGADYIRLLLAADIVVLPLSDTEISAGQMVMLQALAAGKPVIITDTSTTREYVQESDLNILVPVSDALALEKAILKLVSLIPLPRDAVLSQRKLYDDNFSDHVFARKFCRILKQTFPA